MSKKEDNKIIFKPTEHIYVPKHEILSEKEKNLILEKYNVSTENCPQIFVTDPVAREIGAKPGDLLKIVRKSQTAGESIYYRFVVTA